MNREPIRSPARSVANLEFHHTGDHVNEVARKVVAALEEQGVRAHEPGDGLPDGDGPLSGGKIWVVSHKPVAVAAGLGHMGIHRNVIHPRFGNFILLGTVLIGAEATAYDQPISYNPCLECKLCVAACPVGAISPDGDFNFSACYTHNYREFMGGFTDWVEQIADSKDALDYRKKVSDPESASMWQSLSFGANYKAAYCLSVCPAGEDVIGPYLTDKAGHLREVVRPLQEKEETVYVVAGSDAEEHVARRFPLKTIKRVGNGLRPRSIQRLPVGAAAHVSAGEGGEAERRLPLHLHRQGAEGGDRHDPGRHLAGPGRSSGRGRPACDRRQRDVAGLPGERAEPAVGLAPPENPHQGVAEAAGGLRQVFPVVSARRFEICNRFQG